VCSKLTKNVSGKIAVHVAGDLFTALATGLLKLGVTPEGIRHDMFVAESIRATV